MAKRNRVPARKALGGKRERNKNPKLSPYQRELKRNRLANQTPKPINLNVAADGKLNAATMYQKRDAPAKARYLMQFFEERERRAAERKEKEKKLQLEKEEEAEAAAETDESDDEENDNFSDEGEEEDEENDTLGDASSSLEEEDDRDDSEESNDEDDEEHVEDSDDSEEHSNRGGAAVAAAVARIPANPSKRLLALAFTKKERSVFEALATAEEQHVALLKAVRHRPLAAAHAREEATAEAEAAAFAAAAASSGGKKSAKKMKLLEKGKKGASSGQPTIASVKSLNEFIGESLGADAAINLQLLRKKEKKRAKKNDKRREKNMETLAEMDEKMNQAISKSHKKKLKKQRRETPEERKSRLLSEGQQQQQQRLLSGEKRPRSGEDGGDGADGYELPFQVYEREQQQSKTIKRLSKLSDAELAADVSASRMDVVRFGERVEAPPVFDVVPSLSSSFAKFSQKIQNNSATSSASKGTSSSSSTSTLLKKKQDLAAARKPQNKPGRSFRGPTPSSSSSPFTPISSAQTTTPDGAKSLYELKRLTKLGLHERITTPQAHASATSTGGQKGLSSKGGAGSEKAAEMEALRLRVVEAYRRGKAQAHGKPSLFH